MKTKKLPRVTTATTISFSRVHASPGSTGLPGVLPLLSLIFGTKLSSVRGDVKLGGEHAGQQGL